MERKEWKPEQYNSNVSGKLYSLIIYCASKVVDNPYTYTCARPNNLADTGIWYHFPGYDYTWIDFAATAPGRISGIKFNALQTIVWNASWPARDMLNVEYNEACMVYRCSSSLREEKGTYLKPGKLVQAIFPSMDADTAAQVSSILALELRKLQEIDISNIKISDNPSDIYKMTHHDSGSIGNSCMKDKPAYTFDIYDDICQIAYILNDDGELIGRALLHKNVMINNESKNIKLMDRIYCANDDVLMQFIEYARQHRYHRKEEQSLSCGNYIAPNGDILEDPILSIGAENLKERYKKVPYIDTFKHYHEQSFTLCNNYQNGEEYAVTTFDETNGCDDNRLFAHPFTECSHCSNDESDYEMFYIEQDGEHVCIECLERRYAYCDSCDRYVLNEDMVPIDVGGDDEYYCGGCVENIAVHCEYCGRNVYPDYIETTKDDYGLCTHCYNDRTVTCIDCGETYYRDSTVQDGICDTCFEEMESEKIREEMEGNS